MESFSHKHLDNNHCFLCGIVLDDEIRSNEHVIPEWLQRAHDLQGHTLTLLNKTRIPYPQLLIPCCKKCNNEPLAQMEHEVCSFLRGAFQQPTDQQEVRLFQWCSKILYGLLYREMTLPNDRRSKSGQSIIPRQFLEEFSTFYHFMTSIKRQFEFVGFRPYSLFVTETLLLSDPSRNFDYFDSVLMGNDLEAGVTLWLAVRVNCFGVICIFQDNGFQKAAFAEEFKRLEGTPLHPIQFLELACRAGCMHSILSFSPKYHSVMADELDSVVTVVRANGPEDDVWRQWNEARFTQLFCSLATKSGLAVPPPDEMSGLTFLRDAQGCVPVITEADEELVAGHIRP